LIKTLTLLFFKEAFNTFKVPITLVEYVSKGFL